MPTNKEIFIDYLGQTSPTPLMLEIEKAEGVRLYGPGGQSYIDLISGVSVSNTGHRHPEVINAIKKQIDSYLHLMVYGEIVQTPQTEYAKSIIELLPEKLESVYFVNSGSEAIEGAMKLAKRYTGRHKIISFINGYHGGTHGALSLQGTETYKNSFRPLLPGTVQIGFNDFSSLNAIDNTTACVIVEPLQAEAGVILPEEGFLSALREKCDKSGALLVFDEVQTGFGRLGELFAIDKYGVVPDILVLAKAMGGGLPLGAFISSREIMSVLSFNPQLGHITTFGGHPVCCAAGLASLKVILNNDLTENCRLISGVIKKRLIHPAITAIRGEGLLLAIELSNKNYIGYAVNHAPEHGLVIDYFLFNDNAFRVAPPLTMSVEEAEESCARIIGLLDETRKNVKT
jgi:acetylornithine/succinyldiaminopimelate/putrescine aminotransferase